jgi:uncharacterized protein (TIGR02118 family)
VSAKERDRESLALVRVLVLFGTPVDRAGFEQHFERDYHPLLLQVPNLTQLDINRIAGAAKGESPFYMVVEMHFASEQDMQQGLNSEAGQAMASDLSQFASGGVTVLFSQSESQKLIP